MRFAGQVFEDPVEQFHREYEAVPGFGVSPAQKGLQYAFPENTKPQFFEDIKNPLNQPNVERYIYNRHIFDANNPLPIT